MAAMSTASGTDCLTSAAVANFSMIPGHKGSTPIAFSTANGSSPTPAIPWKVESSIRVGGCSRMDSATSRPSRQM